MSRTMSLEIGSPGNIREIKNSSKRQGKANLTDARKLEAHSLNIADLIWQKKKTFCHSKFKNEENVLYLTLP